MEQAARKTFSDVFIEWNTTKLSKRKDGENLLRAIRKDVLPILGEKEIGAVTRADLMKCLDAVTSRGSPRMANVLLNVLKTFYGWAQLREIVIADPLGPVRAADVGGKLPSRDRVLSDAEIDAVLNHKESKGVTQIYQRYDYAKEMADAWAKWGRHLTSLRAQAKGIALVVGD